MIEFYYHIAPNPAKVALFLEESGLEYAVIPVDTCKGEQFDPAFVAINPNSKTPAIVDTDAGVTVFDSNAILLYLAEKTGRFLSDDTLAARGQMLSWLMFVATGIGPYSGQAVHFQQFAPERLAYAVNRYRYETQRHWGILDDRLGHHRYVLGDTYTIVDMAVWGWCGPLPLALGEDVWRDLPNVKRLFDEISARPAALRAAALKQRYDFKTELDSAARRNLFPHNAALQ